MTEAQKRAKKREYMRKYRARKKLELHITDDKLVKKAYGECYKLSGSGSRVKAFYEGIKDGTIDLSIYQNEIENTPLILREIAHLVMSRTKLIDSHNGVPVEYDNICFADLITQNSPLLNREVLAIRCDTKYRIKILIG